MKILTNFSKQPKRNTYLLQEQSQPHSRSALMLLVLLDACLLIPQTLLCVSFLDPTCAGSLSPFVYCQEQPSDQHICGQLQAHRRGLRVSFLQHLGMLYELLSELHLKLEEKWTRGAVVTCWSTSCNIIFLWSGICAEKCQNGGKCVQKDTCECSKGYYGLRCEYCK